MAEVEGLWDGNHNILGDEEEKQVLFAALDSFHTYTRKGYGILHSRRQNLYALPQAHWERLAATPISILDTFIKIEDAIATNGILAKQILHRSLEAFNLPSPDSQAGPNELNWRNKATPLDCSKASTIIRQLFRDWSTAGETERQRCYGPIHKAIDLFAADRLRNSIKILLPGSGLGRCLFDLCKSGYDVEGVEISYHSLLAGSFILNHCSRAEEYDLYPWILSFSNVASRDHQLEKIKVPDIHPATVLEQTSSGGSMSVCTGDFCIVYKSNKRKDQFDVVATAFFIDTAPNFLRYLEAVSNCLKSGGIWVNSGPLLWHFEGEKGKEQPVSKRDAGIGEAGSVELTDEEVLLLLKTSGFRIDHHEIFDEGAGYIQNPQSMMQSKYRLSHWVATKL